MHWIEIFIAGLRWIHIPSGMAGLFVFWIPLVLPKGSLWHRRVGWVFVVCMALAAVTAIGLAAGQAARAFYREKFLASDLIGPLFLSNVGLLTLTAVHHGIAALKLKGKPDADVHLTTKLLPIALLLVSAISLIVGVLAGNPLLFTLPSVGLFLGIQYTVILRSRPREKMVWWYQHMSGMMGGCIAALTAANITNARYLRRWIHAPEWAFWMAPAAIGIPLLIVWLRVYRRRFSRNAQASLPQVVEDLSQAEHENR
jgi:hypothetical protein